MEWMEPSTFGESSIEEDSAGYRDRPARSTFLLLHHAQLRTQHTTSHPRVYISALALSGLSLIARAAAHLFSRKPQSVIPFTLLDRVTSSSSYIPVLAYRPASLACCNAHGLFAASSDRKDLFLSPWIRGRTAAWSLCARAPA